MEHLPLDSSKITRKEEEEEEDMKKKREKRFIILFKILNKINNEK
ncbi:MAG: hypothetical protein Q8P67_27315 [archaeon]|nr:hypothetical protein [archaeon]